MNKISLLFFTVVLLFAISCEKSGNADFENLPVVQAYLSPGDTIEVLISEKIPYDSTTVTANIEVDGLVVTIAYNGGGVTLQSLGGGVYKDVSGAIPVLVDSTYTLSFSYNNELIASTTIIPAKPTSVTQSATTIKMSQMDPENPSGTRPPEPVVISFANEDESYYMTTVECMEANLVPVYKDSVPANDMFSSMPTKGTEIEIQPMRIRYFGLNRIILYHINPEYMQFFKHQASTSQSYEEPPTNITNGLGIFTGINGDTLYLNVVQVK